MNDELRRCPNCGAYVMGNDTRCPRCDFDMRGVPFESNTNARTHHRDDDLAAEHALDAAERKPNAADDLGAMDIIDSAELPPPDAHEPDISADTNPGAGFETQPDAQAGTAAGSEAVAEASAEVGPEVSQEADSESAVADDAGAVVSGEEEASDSGEYGGDYDTASDTDAEQVLAAQDTPARSAASRADIHTTRPGTGHHDDLPVADREPDITEMPTRGFDPETHQPIEPAPDLHATQPRGSQPGYIVPPAPYSPPPVAPPPPPATIAPPRGVPSYASPGQSYVQPIQHSVSEGEAAIAYLQQRVQAYRRGGYRVETHGQYEASLTYGKRLGLGTWILALLTGIGVFWYVLILAASGFHTDAVYVVLENDGRVYEDGPGAAHIRGKRSRTGRRWSAIGLVIFFLSLVTAIVLTVIAGIVVTQDRYQAALREAYPAVTLFEDHFNPARADPGDIDLAKDVAVVFAVVGVVAAVGLWGGATLFVIGTVHASAYRTHVPPLPGWA